MPTLLGFHVRGSKRTQYADRVRNNNDKALHVCRFKTSKKTRMAKEKGFLSLLLFCSSSTRSHHAPCGLGSHLQTVRRRLCVEIPFFAPPATSSVRELSSDGHRRVQEHRCHRVANARKQIGARVHSLSHEYAGFLQGFPVFVRNFYVPVAVPAA